MLHAYDYNTGQGYSIMRGPDGLELLGQADGMQLLGPDGVQLLGPDGMQLLGPDGMQLLGPDGMQLLGPDGMQLLGPYEIGLMAAAEDEATSDGQKEALPTYKLDVDYTCTGVNVCTPAAGNAAISAYKELQTAINRAVVQFPDAGQKVVTVDGVIGPDVMVAAWRIAKYFGPESDPLFKEIGDVNLFDAPQVKVFAVKLATNPFGYKNAFDKLSISAAGEEKKEVARSAKRRGWLAALTIMASLGAVAGVVVYSRKAGNA